MLGFSFHFYRCGTWVQTTILPSNPSFTSRASPLPRQSLFEPFPYRYALTKRSPDERLSIQGFRIDLCSNQTGLRVIVERWDQRGSRSLRQPHHMGYNFSSDTRYGRLVQQHAQHHKNEGSLSKTI